MFTVVPDMFDDIEGEIQFGLMLVVHAESGHNAFVDIDKEAFRAALAAVIRNELLLPGQECSLWTFSVTK